MAESNTLKDLEEFNQDHHLIAFGGAVTAYTLAALAYSGTIDIVEFGIFLMALFPYLYAFELVFDSDYVENYEEVEEEEE